MEILRDLRSCGFLIEMDDFGSGYSSLNLLREMPVDVLKIDMVFLRNTTDHEHERARAIIDEVISLAKRLDIVSLTEGVETEYQYNKLLEMGCQLYQGYYFAKPMPGMDYEQRMSKLGSEDSDISTDLISGDLSEMGADSFTETVADTIEEAVAESTIEMVADTMEEAVTDVETEIETGVEVTGEEHNDQLETAADALAETAADNPSEASDEIKTE